jgi:hypothetical protein
VDDKKQGAFISFDSIGMITQCGYLNNGLVHGEFVKVNKFAVLESWGFYVNGELKRDLRKKPFEAVEKKKKYAAKHQLDLLPIDILDQALKDGHWHILG